MAIVASFSLTQSTDSTSFTLTDTSTGTDGTLTGRRILLYKADGSLFTPAIAWAIGSTTKTVSILDKDYALNIVVFWDTAVSGAYTATKIYAFRGFGKAYLFGLIQAETANPNIVTDKEYDRTKNILVVELDNAVQAIDVGSDYYAAQRCIDRYTSLIQHANLYF